MLKFIVCEDDKKAATSIGGAVKNTAVRCGYRCDVITFYDYDSSFKEFVSSNKERVVYILDIEMPSESGVSVARYIRNIDRESVIIVITSHHEMADEVYKGRLSILTFISKYDRCYEYLDMALEEAIRYIAEDPTMITFTDLGNTITLSAMDILYISKDGRKTLIKTSSRDYYVYTSLDKMKTYLPDYFRQSHRACLVNMRRVTQISSTRKLVYFDNGVTIDLVGAKYEKGLML